MSEPSGGLLCVALVPDDDFVDWDALVADGHAQLVGEAAEAGVRPVGPSTWRLIDASHVEGWEWWAGQLLIATVPAVPVGAGHG
ncbi:hypothetical protein ACQSSU_20485 [Micromonospora echinospora]